MSSTPNVDALIAQVARATSNSVVITDAKRRVLWVNSAFTQLTGYTIEDALGKSPKELLQSEKTGSAVVEYMRRELDAARPLQAVRTAVANGEPWSLELRLQTVKGNIKWVQARGEAEYQDGKPIRLLGTLQDISERKRYEQRLLELNEELRERNTQTEQLRKKADLANRAKSEFLANMSHEIRTPMNGILGMAQLLLDVPLEDRHKEYLKIILKSGQSLLGLINDILDFSRIEAGKMVLKNEWFELSELLHSIIQSHEILATDKGLKLQLLFSGFTPGRVFSDANRLRQILHNLLSNAIKFTEQGIVLLQVSLHTTDDGTEAYRFVVADTGIGIPAENQHLLFERFSQLDSTRTRKHGGSGLGLAISSQLARLMGGTLQIFSPSAVASELFPDIATKGPGSAFHLILPLLPQDAAQTSDADKTSAAKAPMPRNPTSTEALKILLVEDNLINQMVATGMLERIGLHVECVQNGAEALDKLKDTPYDLVLMDIQMPVLDGLEATRRFRRFADVSWANPSTLPIIALTAHAMRGDRETCLAAGMDDYLAKPVDKTTLADTLAKWLPL